MESDCSLCTFNVPQGANNLILCTLDTIQTFFVSRLIINQINKVQWVDFKLENVLVSLHSLKKKVFANSVQEGQSSVYDTKNTECTTLRGENAVHFLCTPK
jgi:hypothetical protein